MKFIDVKMWNSKNVSLCPVFANRVTYDDTKPGSESHMVKVLKVTHDVRRSKINSSALSTVAIEKQYTTLTPQIKGKVCWML